MKRFMKPFYGINISINAVITVTLIVFIISMLGFFAVAQNDETTVTIDSLINDEMLEVKNVNWNYEGSARTPENPEWNTLLQSNAPLQVNESYTEDFSKSFFESRLRPTIATYIAPDIPPDASFRYVESNGKKSLMVETNGSVGGVYDYIEFSGMKFIDGAYYTLDIDYTVLAPTRVFKIGFGSTANTPYFMDLTGDQVGQKKTASGSFTAEAAYGLGSDIHAALIMVIAGGDDPASIQIDKMTIKRLPSKPKALNAKITGNSAVGGALTLSYDYYQDAGVAEGATEIIWFLSNNSTGKNMTLMNSTAGMKTITVTSDMNGYYIGAYIIAKTITPNQNGIGDGQVTIANSPVGTPIAYGTYELDEIGESFTENFEDVSYNGNLSFTPDYGVTSYITDKAGVSINGKSLYIDSVGGIKGGVFDGINFEADGNYVVSFNYKFIDKAPSNLYVQFRSPSQGYSADIYQMISSPAINTVKAFKSKPFKLNNASDYIMQLFDAYGPYKVVIDDLKIEYVEPVVVIPGPPETPADDSTLADLATVGKPFTENFTKNAIGSLWSYDLTHFSVVEDTDAIAGKSIKQDFTNAANGTIYAFDTKGKLAAGGKYRVTLKYKLLTDKAPTGMYFGFTRDGGANQKNIQFNFAGNQKNTVYIFTADYTLDNFSDYYAMWFNLNGKDGSIIVIDTLTIERLAAQSSATEETPSDTSTLNDLKTIGKTFTENFTKNALGSLWSYDLNHFGVVQDTQAIAGKSIKQDFTNAANGTIYAFDTKGKLAAGGKYRVTLQYKLLTDKAPTGMYFGFTRDGGANQKNIQFNFAGNQKNTVYTFTADYTLDNYSDYYAMWFNLNGKDGSIIVIDTLTIERIA